MEYMVGIIVAMVIGFVVGCICTYCIYSEEIDAYVDKED